MKTIAAWVTHLTNADITWERFDDGMVEIRVTSKIKDNYSFQPFSFGVTSGDWDDITRVLALKDNGHARQA